MMLSRVMISIWVAERYFRTSAAGTGIESVSDNQDCMYELQRRVVINRWLRSCSWSEESLPQSLKQM